MRTAGSGSITTRREWLHDDKAGEQGHKWINGLKLGAPTALTETLELYVDLMLLVGPRSTKAVRVQTDSLRSLDEKKRLRPVPAVQSALQSMVSVDLAKLLVVIFGWALLLAQSRRDG